MFDIVGDVHGCDDELVDLLRVLGHPPDPGAPHPDGRRLVFVGDLVDRGPATPAVLRRVMALAAAGRALVLAGNHDVRLADALRGRAVEPGHGLEESLAQLAREDADFRARVPVFIEGLPTHLVLDGGRLVVAHAGLPEAFHGVDSPEARDHAVHGAYTGDFDERGMPVRDDWAARYRGAAAVVQGHTPVIEAEWFHNTICIDTACVHGGRLTALRWPERELVAVPARGAWARSARPPLVPRAAAPRPVRQAPEALATPAETVARLRARAAALAAVAGGDNPAAVAGGESPAALAGGDNPAAVAGGDNPTAAAGGDAPPAGWGPYVVHLPPTMSSCDPGGAGRPLEHPLGAMAHYARQGLRGVVCQEKHDGVRVVAVVCRDAEAAGRCFGVTDGSAGTIHTRVGRPVLERSLEERILAEIRAGAGSARVWESLATDFLCLDGELVGPAPGRLVLFHVLAAAGATFFDRGHDWQLALLERVVAADATGAVRAVRQRSVDLEKPVEVAAAIAWWHRISDEGGEGIVVKPLVAASSGRDGPVQPALKVRSAARLARVYGDASGAGLEGLRRRSLETKRARALDQFALGIESLARFVAGAPRDGVTACLDALLDWKPSR